MYAIHTLKVSVEITAMQKIAEVTTLKAKDYRVLFHLMSHLDGRSAKKVSAKSIAKQLDLDKEDVNKAISRLVDAELLVQESNEHVKEGYRFTF